MDHEKEAEGKLIVESFAEFVSCCESKYISDASRKSPAEREAVLIKNGKGQNISDGLREMWKKEYEKYKDMVQREVLLD